MTERVYPGDEQEGRLGDELGDADRVEIDVESQTSEGLGESSPDVVEEQVVVEDAGTRGGPPYMETGEEVAAAVPPERIGRVDEVGDLEKESEGRFDSGQAEEPLTLEKEIEGRFDEGQQEAVVAEVPPERTGRVDEVGDLEKESEGRFDSGQEEEPLTLEDEVEGRFDEGQQEGDRDVL